MATRFGMRMIILVMAGLFLAGEPAEAARRRMTLQQRYGGQSVQMIYALGVEYLDARKYDESIILLEMAREKLKQKEVVDTEFRADVFSQLARVYFEKGKSGYVRMGDVSWYDQALVYGMQSLEYDPHHWLSLFTVARIYRYKKKFDKADYFYKEAQKYADPTNPETGRLFKEYQVFKKFQERFGQGPGASSAGAEAPEPAPLPSGLRPVDLP